MSAPRAQLFFSTSPLFGALWALLLLHEPITNHELVGGAVLLLGLLAASQVPEKADEPSAAEALLTEAEPANGMVSPTLSTAETTTEEKLGSAQ